MSDPNSIWDPLPCSAATAFGIIMGILFVLDGWKGSPKSNVFQQTFRYKNLGFVLAGAFAVFLTHLKTSGSIDDSSLLFFWYIIPLTITVIVGIFIVALVVHSGCATAQRSRPGEYPNPPYAPILTYLHYGYAQYQEDFEKQRKAKIDDEYSAYRNWVETFRPEYEQAVAITIQSIPASTKDPSNWKEAVPVYLTYICGIVALHHRKNRQQLTISANFMRSYSCSKISEQDDKVRWLRFAKRSFNEYDSLLVLESMNRGAAFENISLPVEKKDSAVSSLPGAPAAFKAALDTREDDTAAIKYHASLGLELIRELKKFYEDKHFRSFASLVLRHPVTRQPIGIVNIESTQTYVFGQENEDHVRIESMLRPFVIALEIVVSGA